VFRYYASVAYVIDNNRVSAECNASLAPIQSYCAQAYFSFYEKWTANSTESVIPADGDSCDNGAVGGCHYTHNLSGQSGERLQSVWSLTGSLYEDPSGGIAY
jgi:hypothetical protein